MQENQWRFNGAGMYQTQIIIQTANGSTFNISDETLNNPPKEYEEAYSVLKTYYDNYLSMNNMVINPAGSLQSFSDEFNNADTQTVNSYKKI